MPFMTMFVLHLVVQTQPPARSADPAVARELAAAASVMRSQLPLTQQTPNGAVTFTAMKARGNELITNMSLPVDLDEETFGVQFGEQLPVQACANTELAALISRGATITYIVRDPEGDEFRASVSSC